MGDKLENVAKELWRCAKLLKGEKDDTIRIFDEVNGRVEVNYNKIADKKFHANDKNGHANGNGFNGSGFNGSSGSSSGNSSAGSSDIDQ